MQQLATTVTSHSESNPTLQQQQNGHNWRISKKKKPVLFS
jgi:hypothetical protein